MPKPKKNLLEWTVFAVSAVIVAAAVGYLAWSAITEDSGEADLRVSTGSAVARGGAFVVPVTVRNLGNETAEQVRVEVVLRRGGREVERAELEMLYVPRKSRREGFVTFRDDPRGAEVRTRVLGYEMP